MGDRENLGDSPQFLLESSQPKSGMRVSQELGLNERRKRERCREEKENLSFFYPETQVDPLAKSVGIQH